MHAVQITFIISVEKLNAFGVLSLVKARCPKSLRHVFNPNAATARKQDCYGDGNDWNNLLLHWEDMLQPVLQKALNEDSSRLLMLFTQLWWFWKTLATIVHVITTTNNAGYSAQVLALALALALTSPLGVCDYLGAPVTH